MEAFQAEVGGFVGVPAASEGGLTAEEVVKEHSPLLETQEEEEVKVGHTGVKGCDGSDKLTVTLIYTHVGNG